MTIASTAVATIPIKFTWTAKSAVLLAFRGKPGVLIGRACGFNRDAARSSSSAAIAGAAQGQAPANQTVRGGGTRSPVPLGHRAAIGTEVAGHEAATAYSKIPASGAHTSTLPSADIRTTRVA